MQKDPRAFLQLAEEHRRMGRLKEAIAICLEGLGQHPNLHAASITLGRSYLESGMLQDARTTLEGVCARLPEHHLAAKLLAETQCRMGDLASAAATCKAILLHYPRDREFEAMLAEIAAELERPAPAASQAASGTSTMGVAATSATATSAAATAAKGTAAAGTVAAATAAARAAASADPDLEYAPEDVNLPAQPAAPARPPVMAEPAKRAAKSPTVTPPAPIAAPAPAAAATKAGDDALQTNTLAELYLKQGLVERAMDVYRAMLRVDATNERARKRLAELEGAVAAGESPAALRTAPAAQEEQADPVSAQASPSATASDSRRATVVRLERWRDRMTAGKSGGVQGTGR